MNALGLYIHVPFCKKACVYCNFHFSTRLTNVDAMVEAIAKELTLRASEFQNYQLKTIYFGGGTPSILDESQVAKIMKSIPVSKEYVEEITIECNPDDINYEKIRMFQSVGCNRVSLGVQSFRNVDLQWMNRSHDAGQAVNSITLLQALGMKEISVDLIYGLPGMTMEDWDKNIDRVLSFHIPHISAYQMTVEEKTALIYQLKKGRVRLPVDEFVNNQLDLLIKKTKTAGYEHYEISNYALSGKRAKHNSLYWVGVPYIGIGPGAHSFRDNIRSWNISNNTKYIEALNVGKRLFEQELLDTRDMYNEWIITGIRTCEGLNTNMLKERFSEFRDHFDMQTPYLFRNNWIVKENNMVKLTESGIHMADRVSVELMSI